MGIPDMNLFGMRIPEFKKYYLFTRWARSVDRKYEFPYKLVHKNVENAFQAYVSRSFPADR